MIQIASKRNPCQLYLFLQKIKFSMYLHTHDNLSIHSDRMGERIEGEKKFI